MKFRWNSGEIRMKLVSLRLNCSSDWVSGSIFIGSEEIRMKFGWDYDEVEKLFGSYCISNLNGRLQVFFFGFFIEIWFEFFEPLFLKFCKFKQSVINFMWYFNNANISLVKQFIHVFQFSSAIFMLLPQMIWKSCLSFSSSSYDIGGSRLECSNLKPPIEKTYILNIDS